VDETTAKLSLLRNLATRYSLDAILLQRVSSIAWATSGASAYVNTACTKAEVSLLITNENHYLFTNNIEAPRLDKEEMLGQQGWNFQLTPWYENSLRTHPLAKGLKLGADDYYPGAEDLSTEMAHLRANLNNEEGKRFRILGQQCAQVMDAAARSVRTGMTEHEIAGLLAGAAEQRGVQAIVNLVAVDERIYHFRHPLPTNKKLDHYAMLILCGRRWGLVCSLTRLLHFNRLPEEIRRKADAVARVDAAMIAATRPGSTLGQVFSCAQVAYAAEGYPDEWQLHHQGGTAGYEPREYLATPGCTDGILSGQVFAWNPSITGCKSEDSILVGEAGFEILTAIPGWPVTRVEIAGQMIERPGILVVE
jgi:Xaa-Pro aminopeptidase